MRFYRESDAKPVIKRLAEQLGVHPEALRDRFGVEPVLRVLNIAPSTYCGWLAREAAPARGLLSEIVNPPRCRGNLTLTDLLAVAAPGQREQAQAGGHGHHGDDDSSAVTAVHGGPSQPISRVKHCNWFMY
ncbi:hypothetical protein GCM10010399_15810 [Dactylosporangium fulvum]|uniref:Uncharacterized protein n=1 Tax=Dactylosporangium fulvum TaxID=53359 RepID=A0ABY5VRH4_9ACTN|nr:hypothetical protein [Dactylosporangium fulvum]UWP80140.1 hypothetical protein Dfulv_33945 [Dactylosporangium fulvum]